MIVIVLPVKLPIYQFTIIIAFIRRFDFAPLKSIHSTYYHWFLEVGAFAVFQINAALLYTANFLTGFGPRIKRTVMHKIAAKVRIQSLI